MTTTAPRATGTSDGLSSLSGRAIAAARRCRQADPYGFDHRDDAPDTRARRARIARAIVATLEVPLDAVTVTDDPHRRYGIGRGVSGDLVTVTDTDTAWRFVPDLSARPDERWVFLDDCPDCGAPVPMIPVTTLADLGEWLDPDLDDRYDRVLQFGFFDGDPAHRPDCPYNPDPTTADAHATNGDPR